MIYKVFSLYDSAVEAYNVPMFLRTNGEAIRSLTAAVNDSESTICKWPDQYVLFELGTYDDSDGSFCPLSAPKSLGSALQYKAEPKGELPLEAAISKIRQQGV
ncbi:MAG: nonstructural protein [Microviridae sp.]|nr:MAG: nonstructural protein [Microviridae sp.]